VPRAPSRAGTVHNLAAIPVFLGLPAAAAGASWRSLRAAHDVLAELYADRLANVLDRMPAERAVLGLFCDLTLAAGLGVNVVDVGCGTGRLEPRLAARGPVPGWDRPVT
jgi:2-polyprenyl-3-methyl-5-hydroxy-6-metoxy-1,4-benzoquinol methylase